MEQQQQEEEERQSPPPQPPPPAPDKTAAGADESERSRLMSEALQREDEFLEYIMSLSGGDAGSAQDSGVAEEDDGAAAPASAAPDGAPPGTAGLDHLDNLCKLMEQLGDLKEQNTKLQRRVQYLEDAKRLRAVPRDSPPAPPPPPPPPPPGPVVIPRGRSRSVGLQKSKAKVSKWTKVKEAFRWERAALAADHHKAAAHAAASSSSSSSDDLDLSMHFADIFPDAGGPGSSGGGSVSAAESRRLSFPEEEHDEDARRSRSLDADAITCQLSGKDISPLSKSPSGKAHRTPWGKVKDIIIQTRKDSLKRRGAGSTDAHLDATGDGDAPQEADAAKAPRLTLTTASSEELRWPDPQRPPPKPSPSPVTDPEEERRPSHQGSPPPARRHSSKWTKVKKAFLTARPGSPPYSPRDHETFGYAAQAGESDEAPAESLHAEVQRSYEELQHKLSLEFQEKLAEWERARLAVAAAADLGAEETAHDRGAQRHHQHHHQQQYPLSADFRKKLSEWQRRKDEGSPRAARKPAKELLWLEKELHKIAREKARLERERDKFLQREARLEKMRKAMCAGQEVLVQTSTGSFRFQGISEAFTRRLFEWEQARGIGPEDSTFALLDPRFRPLARQSAGHDSGPPGAESALLSRCKSAGSVAPGASVAALTRQASSLSLNDAQLEAATAAAAATPPLEDGRAVSEPRLRTGGLEDADADDGPAALIVDVEDEVVETAGPLAAAPAVRGRTPVYCYAPREVARLIDSSGSESDRAIGAICRNESVRTEKSYRLLDENVDLLNKLKNNEDICRKLEAEIEELETKMAEAARSREQQLQNLEKASEGRQVALLRARVRELERRHERLKRQGATLQDSFAARSEQQAALACHLVGNMKQLQAQGPGYDDPLTFVRDLSTQVLQLSEQLAAAVRERSGPPGTTPRRHRLGCGLTWLSADGISLSADSLQDEGVDQRQDLRQLPALLTSKVLELKRGLSFLCGTEHSGDTAVEEARAAVRSRRKARQSQASSDSESDDDNDEDDEVDPAGSVQPAQGPSSGLSPSVYETEVPPPNKGSCRRHKQLLRTRRASDTHVGYRATESPLRAHQRYTDESDNSVNEERTSSATSPPESRSVPGDSDGGSTSDARSYRLVDNEKLRDRSSSNDDGLPELQHRIVPPGVEDTDVVEEDGEAPTNVFVKTTRKIFSPVRRDSKGKASSVIGFVVGDSLGGSRVANCLPTKVEEGDETEKKEEMSTSGSVPGSPARLLRHSRSKSASPATVRRPSAASKDGSSGADSSSSSVMTSEERRVTIKVNGVIEQQRVKDEEDKESQEERKSTSTEDSPKPARSKAVEGVPVGSLGTPIGLPPMAHSPLSSRRGGADQARPPAKETAPSIRMMIAKYNQKLEESAAAEAPSSVVQVTGGSGGSPVAWRSPGTERRVRLQMERYQEEVRRALENSGASANTGSRHVQKSASVGFIPVSPHNRPAGGSPRKPPLGPATTQVKGILKSSSAGAIQTDFKRTTSDSSPASSDVPKTVQRKDAPESRVKDSSLQILGVHRQSVRTGTHSASSSPLPPQPVLRASVSPATSNPSSPELVQRRAADAGGDGAGSPPPSRLRALRLRRAKEEFLTRGAASQSWTGGDDGDGPDTGTGRARAGGSPGPAAGQGPDDAQLLVKSASAGAISPDEAAGAAGNKAPRLGLAGSIAARFRKVKMRRGSRGQPQGAVSALCRQSLLVDLGGAAAERAAPASKSCPSSPVLRRPPPPQPPANDDEPKSSCWVKKKIFRPKS